MQTEGYKTALVVGSEHLTDFIDYSDRKTCILFGDGAGAFVLKKDDTKKPVGSGIISCFMSSSGDLERYLGLEYREGTKIRKVNGRIEKDDGVWQQYVKMEGNKIFEYAGNAMVEAVHQVIAKSRSFSLMDVDAIIPHGANFRIIKYAYQVLKKKKYPGNRFYNLYKYGNTSAASTPIALEMAALEGQRVDLFKIPRNFDKGVEAVLAKMPDFVLNSPGLGSNPLRIYDSVKTLEQLDWPGPTPKLNPGELVVIPSFGAGKTVGAVLLRYNPAQGMLYA
jgi:3-oxoacyl-[acyl-carrier-protein] synthase III